MKLLILSALLCGVLAGGNKYGYGPYGGYGSYRGYGHGGHAVTNVRIGGYGYGTVSSGYGPLGSRGYAYGGSLFKKEKDDDDKSGLRYGYGGYGYGGYGPLGYGGYGYGGPILKKEDKDGDDDKTERGYEYGGYGYGGYGRGVYGHGGYGYGGYKGLYQKVSSHYGNTAFAYNDGLSTRSEHIAYDGSRIGSYSVLGADGKLRTVKYKTGKDGFQLLDDSGVVKEDNVARAAELAKLTPVAPEVPDVPDVPEVPEVPEADLPVAPTNAPDYGKRNENVYKARKNAYAPGHYGGYYGGLGHGRGGYGYGGYGHGRYGYGYAPVSYGYSVKRTVPVYSYKNKAW